MKTRSFLLVITVWAFCSACGDNGNNTASVSAAASVQDECAPVCAESEAGEGGAVVAEQNDEFGTPEAYPVADSCAGPFRIGAEIPRKIEGFAVTESREEKTLPNGETREIPVYLYEIGNEGWVRVTPQYDPVTGGVNGKTGEIFVYSDLFLTDQGIGAMSSIGEFAAAYPDFRIRYAGEAELFVVETPRLGNVQFVIDDEYYQGDDAVRTSNESCELQVSDFRKESYFTAIRIINI